MNTTRFYTGSSLVKGTKIALNSCLYSEYGLMCRLYGNILRNKYKKSDILLVIAFKDKVPVGAGVILKNGTWDGFSEYGAFSHDKTHEIGVYVNNYNRHSGFGKKIIDKLLKRYNGSVENIQYFGGKHFYEKTLINKESLVTC